MTILRFKFCNIINDKQIYILNTISISICRDEDIRRKGARRMYESYRKVGHKSLILFGDRLICTYWGLLDPFIAVMTNIWPS